MRKEKRSDQFTIIPFERLKTSSAWKLTSELVRRKALVNPQEKDKKKWICKCYTCGRLIPYEKACAGHAREKRGGSAIYFDYKDGIRCQCNYCNRRLHGNYGVFTIKLLDEIGRERIDAYNRKAQKSKVWTKADLFIIETILKDELKKL